MTIVLAIHAPLFPAVFCAAGEESALFRASSGSLKSPSLPVAKTVIGAIRIQAPPPHLGPASLLSSSSPHHKPKGRKVLHRIYISIDNRFPPSRDIYFCPDPSQSFVRQRSLLILSFSVRLFAGLSCLSLVSSLSWSSSKRYKKEQKHSRGYRGEFSLSLPALIVLVLPSCALRVRVPIRVQLSSTPRSICYKTLPRVTQHTRRPTCLSDRSGPTTASRLLPWTRNTAWTRRRG